MLLVVKCTSNAIFDEITQAFSFLWGRIWIITQRWFFSMWINERFSGIGSFCVMYWFTIRGIFMIGRIKRSSKFTEKSIISEAINCGWWPATIGCLENTQSIWCSDIMCHFQINRQKHNLIWTFWIMMFKLFIAIWLVPKLLHDFQQFSIT